MVFQSYALYPNMSVAQNMAFGMEMRGVPKPQRDKAVAEVAKTLQIEHLLDRRPSQLSGGQRQRVAMGRALVRQPRVFLFDEPLSNLDAKLRVDMRVEIKRLHQVTGTTIVYVTHDQIEAMTLATKIAVLKDGELQQVGTPNEIYNMPSNLFVADFMGSPAMNLLEGKVTRADGGAEDRARARGPRADRASAAVERGREQARRRRQGDLRHSAGGGERPRKHRPQREVRGDVQRERRDCRAGGVGHVRRHSCRRQGTDGAHARRRRLRVGQNHAFAFNLDKAVLFDPQTHAANLTRGRLQRASGMTDTETADVVIVGSGMGGATLAAGLAPSGARIVILERGELLPDSPDARDARAIFQRGVYRPQETWIDGAGAPFNPGNYYYVGGNTKLYGAVLIRYRSQDFAPVEHAGGATPGWPFAYSQMEPWYGRAEALYQVRGALGDDPTEPAAFDALPAPAGPRRTGDRQGALTD